MTKIGNCVLGLLVLSASGLTSRAQDASARESFRVAGPAVTISITERGVRFAALGSFGKMRLEVFNGDGTSLYNSDFGAASVRDWVLDDKDGQHFPDGTYLCVITIRDLSGRLTTKQGSFVLQGGQPSLKLPDGESVEVVEPDKSLARVTDPPNTALTLIGHDGDNGQVVNTRGALTFRFGDFFGGKDQEQMRLTEEGNLGLGTSKPKFKLDVAGAIRARQGFVFNDGSTLNVNDQGALTLRNNERKSTVTLTNGGTITPNVAGTGTVNYIAKWAETGGTGTLQNSGIFETVGGNVGIGTASPANKLDVVRGTAGQMAKGFYEMSSFEYDADAKFGVYSSASSAPSAALTFGSTNLQVNSKFPGFELQYTYGNTAASNQSRFNYVERDASGQVINFAANLLAIKGNGNVTLNPATVGVTASPRLAIGTASPDAPLTVVGDGATLPTVYNNGEVATFVAPNDSFNAVSIAKGGVANPQGLVFGVNHASLYSEIQSSHMGVAPNALVLNRQGGNVGIGTSNPQSLLDINGNLNVTGNATISGNIAAKYQDIAEWTSARSKLPSGTVVSLDMLKPNSVMASDKPYDTRVAGVVSAQPGVILGEGGPNRVLVATTGRVRVRVNAKRYPIRIGDLLVTSNTPGVAMKSQPFRVHGKVMHRPGTIIGKALESLSSGEGTILVLLSMQ